MNNNKRCWKQYNKSLVQRGSITFGIDEDLLKNRSGIRVYQR